MKWCPRLLFFCVLRAVLTCLTAQEADRFVPGKGYALERLDPVMPPNLNHGPAPAFAPGVEAVEQTKVRAESAEMPAGCRLLSQGCRVTTGDARPAGDLQRLTDGDRRDEAGRGVLLAAGPQWVQVELPQSAVIHCVWIWRSHREPVVFHGVKAEVADQPDGPWETIYNTDPRSCCGKPDPLHVELHTGFPIVISRGIAARYVRLWSAGSDRFPENRYLEISIYGRAPGAPPADYFRPAEGGKEKLEPEMPVPWFTMAPHGPPAGDNVENWKVTLERKDSVFLAPGCRLLSLRSPVEVSDKNVLGDPAWVTDGNRSAKDHEFIDMAPGKQWVRIDLGAAREVHCVWLWLRDRMEVVACHDVLVHVSDHPDFSTPATVFNNDHDNSLGMGKGTEKEWEETLYGRAITFPAVKGRYVRVITNGRSLDGINYFTEVAVYGKDIPPPASLPNPPQTKGDDADLVRKIHRVITEKSAGSLPGQMTAYTATRPVDGVKFDMVPIPGGEFVMGSPDTEPDRKAAEGPRIRVKVDPFWMGAREVTWDEYYPFLTALTPSGKPVPEGNGNAIVDAVTRPSEPGWDHTLGMGFTGYPAIGMTQHAALKYCQWLSAQTGHFYRLPTEAEWEYAARAGAQTAWFFGDGSNKLGDYAWYFENSGMDGDAGTRPAGRKKPNPWGLYDIYGNAAEWTLDQFAADWFARLNSQAFVQENPLHKPVTLYPRTVRGGSWDDDAKNCRSASRQGSSARWELSEPGSLWHLSGARTVGFRVVRPLRIPSAEEMNEVWNLGSGVRKP